MSVQRRRGRPITFYPQKKAETRRGDPVLDVDFSKPIKTRCAASADRSSRGEVPGQLGIDIIAVIVPYGLPGVGLWSRAFYNEHWWDVLAPPMLRYGKAGVQHWTVHLRLRPNDGRPKWEVSADEGESGDEEG